MEQRFYAISDLIRITGLTRQGIHYMLKSHKVSTYRYGNGQGLILLKERDFNNAVNKGIFKVNWRVR